MEIAYYQHKEEAENAYNKHYKWQGNTLLQSFSLMFYQFYAEEDSKLATEFFLYMNFAIICDQNSENFDFMKGRLKEIYKEEYMPYYKEKVVEDFLEDVVRMKEFLSFLLVLS